jgi:hypothetical protein
MRFRAHEPANLPLHLYPESKSENLTGQFFMLLKRLTERTRGDGADIAIDQAVHVFGVEKL